MNDHPHTVPVYTFEPMRPRAGTRSIGTLNPDRTRSRRAKARSIELRKARTRKVVRA